MSEVVLYQDKDVKVTDKNVTIYWYYFPIAKSKVIPLSKIQKVQLKELGLAKYRLWGMDAFAWGYWLPGDKNRASRQLFVGLDTGSSVKPSFTTAKVDTVFKLIKQLVQKNKQKSTQEQLKEVEEEKQGKKK